MTMHDNSKKIELKEARKAGQVPPEVDENGKEINPHIPHFIANVPWYLNTDNTPSLSHQKKRKSDSNHTQCDDRGCKTSQTSKNRKNACQNCGAMTHDAKSCLERPRKVGAKRASGDIAITSDKKRETSELSYDGKRDRWNGYNAEYYSHLVMKRYEKGDLSVDEAKVDESKQMDFAKVEKRVCTTGGGSTGTVRNLRLREDTAKYLRNLDVNSAHYDPKTRSMREDPHPVAHPNEKLYEGDNQYRNSGQALEYKELNMHMQEAFDKGQDVHIQAAPSQAEFLYKNLKIMKEKLKSQMKETILEKYGNAADWDQLPRELLLGQSVMQVEYDRAGRIIKGQEAVLPRSKYEEDILINNHATVWGSWWNDHQWGYKCCMQTIHNSYCTGAAGIEAAETANMKNFRRHFRHLCC